MRNARLRIRFGSLQVFVVGAAGNYLYRDKIVAFRVARLLEQSVPPARRSL
jgi:hypothetical protein